MAKVRLRDEYRARVRGARGIYAYPSYGREHKISAKITVQRTTNGPFRACISVGRGSSEPDTTSCGYGKNPRKAMKDMFRVAARFGVGARKRGAFAGLRRRR